MTERGRTTRERLVVATRQVVREVGYSRATTRAIARAADVTEGTIYRHFPDKTAMFFAAALGPHDQMLAAFADLPALAGTGTVAGNLTAALTRLAQLREDVVPLELALLTDPELAAARPAAPDGPRQDGPPERLAEYLAAEQRQGRVRADVDPHLAVRTLLGLLFALALRPEPGAADADLADDPSLIARTVELVVHGLGPASAPTTSG